MSNWSASLTGWVAKQWCAWTHGGGIIKRDGLDRINWQCAKCGRWAEPVPPEVEARVLVSQTERIRAMMQEDPRP